MTSSTPTGRQPSRHSRADYSVLLYSDNSATRDRMRLAIGARPAPDLGSVEFLDATTVGEVLAAADAGSADLLLLDGEAWPSGGMGISRQLKNELASCPPICLLVARQADRWLATWSQADAVIAHPLDPIATSVIVAQLLRARPAKTSMLSS